MSDTNESSEERRTILVVDDDEAVRRLLERVLRRAGFRVISARSVRRALVLLGSNDIALVLSDIHMPTTDGLELVGMVKRNRPGIPVLLMTGNAGRYTRTMAMKAGADDYILKPFNHDSLTAKIHSHIQDSESRVDTG